MHLIEIHLPIFGGTSCVLFLNSVVMVRTNAAKVMITLPTFFLFYIPLFSIFLLDSIIQHPAFLIRKKSISRYTQKSHSYDIPNNGHSYVSNGCSYVGNGQRAFLSWQRAFLCWQRAFLCWQRAFLCCQRAILCGATGVLMLPTGVFLLATGAFYVHLF